MVVSDVSAMAGCGSVTVVGACELVVIGSVIVVDGMVGQDVAHVALVKSHIHLAGLNVVVP